MRRLEKTDLLVIDDWGMYPLDAEVARDMFEILECRTSRGSVIIVSQVPVDAWYDTIPAPNHRRCYPRPIGPQRLLD